MTPDELMAEAYKLRDPAGHYALIGVSPDASLSEITDSFRSRKFAMRMHSPELQERGRIAFEVLSDSIRRASYDPAWVKSLRRR